MTEYKASAVVPTHNSEVMVSACLDSLLNQEKKFDEIIVVDDTSTDKTVSIAKQYPVTLIELTEHKERSFARNLGRRHAEGNIIAFIEADAVLNKGWLNAVLDSFEQGADAVLDTCRVYKPKSFVARMNDDFYRIRLKNSYMPFSAWTFKREVLEDVGDFDVNLNCGEDADLGKRVLAKGYTIVHQPRAIKYHEGDPRSLHDEFRRRWWFGAHILPFYRKNPEKVPKFSFMLSALLMLSALNLPIFTACFAALYLAHFAKVVRMGMRLTYAFVFPLVVIVGNWLFFISFFASTLRSRS